MTVCPRGLVEEIVKNGGDLKDGSVSPTGILRLASDWLEMYDRLAGVADLRTRPSLDPLVDQLRDQIRKDQWLNSLSILNDLEKVLLARFSQTLKFPSGRKAEKGKGR